MAAKTVRSKGPAVNQVEADIRAGALKNLYLIYGEETELKRIFSGRLVRAIGNEEDGMNFQRFEGRAATVEAIIDAADTLPFFAESRTVLVKESGLFKTKQDELADYLKELPASTYLIFVESEVDKKFRLFKAVESIGCAQEYVMLTGDDLKNEVARRIAKAGFKVRSSTVDYFLEQTGADLTAIQNQLDKACAYADGREELTKEDIDAVVTNLIERETYLLTESVARKDRALTMRIYYELMRMKAAEPVGIIVQLTKHFNRLLQLKEMRSSDTDDTVIMSKLKVSKGQLYYLKQQSPIRSREELIAAINDCVRAQEDVIVRGMNDRVTVESLLIKHTK